MATSVSCQPIEVSSKRMSIELEKLLQKASLRGRDVVIEGHRDRSLLHIIECYFRSDAFTPFRQASLEERVAAYKLWDRIKALTSEAKMTSQDMGSVIFSYLPKVIKSCFPHTDAVEDFLSNAGEERRLDILRFTEEDFLKYWEIGDQVSTTIDPYVLPPLTFYQVKVEQIEERIGKKTD